MKAAVLERFGGPLRVRSLADPRPSGGDVLVEVLATRVLSYSAEVFSGARRYDLDPPVVPGVGGVGRVMEIGPDATRVKPGDVVWCDPIVRSRDDALTPDITLQGWTFRGEGGRRLAQHYHDGSFAERMVVPTENVTVLPPGADAKAAMWCCVGTELVTYGGLLAIDFAPGETLVVSGATGRYGSAAVAVGLAMGAAIVVCPGRNTAVLAELSRRHGDRVRTVELTGDPDSDRRAMQTAAGRPIDAAIDLLPPSAGTAPVRTVVLALRESGRAVLMGGVGSQGGPDLALPYHWLMLNNITVRGQWMYPRTASARLIGLVRSGQLRIDIHDITMFGLGDVNAAVEHAYRNTDPFHRTVLTPTPSTSQEETP